MRRNASRSSDRDPMGAVLMCFINAYREINLERPIKIWRPRFNRNGSPLRMHLDRWWSFKRTDRTVSPNLAYKTKSSSIL